MKRVEKVGNHILYNGDVVSCLKRVPENWADVTITSPPYNIGIDYGTDKDIKTEEDYLSWIKTICTEVKRILKKDGSFFLNISGSGTKPWLPFLIASELRGLFFLQNHIVWVKALDDKGHFKPVAGSRFLHRAHEHVFHLTHEGDVKLDRLAIGVPYADKSNIARRGHAQDLRCRGNTWFIPYETIQAGRGHPAPFPVGLPLMCMKLHGRAGANVLDPFVGSGTTLVAAQRFGGTGLGIDSNPEYLRLAQERLRYEIDGILEVG